MHSAVFAGLFASLLLASNADVAIALTGTTTTLKTAVIQKLNVEVPGLFQGCTSLQLATDSAAQSLLDLIKPSAFTTSTSGQLIGAAGPIASAELVSLKPQEVRYVIGAGYTWSDGAKFSGADLVAWWARERNSHIATNTGYRDIQKMQLSSDGLAVVATFTSPFSGWNTLFRDIEAPGTSNSCDIAKFVHRPTLGPYEVSFASRYLVVLRARPNWVAGQSSPRYVFVRFSSTPTYYRDTVGYVEQPSFGQVGEINEAKGLNGRFLPSNTNTNVYFSTRGAASRTSKLRSVLTATIDRQLMVSRLWPEVPGIAPSQSAIETDQQWTPVTSNSSLKVVSLSTQFCDTCAAAVLHTLGYSQSQGQWKTRTGHPFTVDIGTDQNPVDVRLASDLADTYRRFGFSVSTRVTSGKVLTSLLGEGGIDEAVVSTTTDSLAPRSVSVFLSTSATAFRDLVPMNALQQEATIASHSFNVADQNVAWRNFEVALESHFLAEPIVTDPTELFVSNNVELTWTWSSPRTMFSQIPTLSEISVN